VALTEIDRSLLKRCLAREPGAWKDFVDRFIGLFVHVIQHTAHVRSVKVTSHDVDDLCADVFVALLADDFAVLRRFRAKSSLATYLTVVARRVVVREMARKRMAEALGHVNSQTQGALESPSRTIEHQRIDDREEVERLLEDLVAADAEVVKQFHLQGKSYREISSHLGIPENSIGPTLSRARDRMRRRQVQS
jgi:RNA polymerase sigma-70 factor (ECF subfamily)